MLDAPHKLAVFQALHLLTKDLGTKFGQQQSLADSVLLLLLTKGSVLKTLYLLGSILKALYLLASSVLKTLYLLGSFLKPCTCLPAPS